MREFLFNAKYVCQAAYDYSNISRRLVKNTYTIIRAGCHLYALDVRMEHCVPCSLSRLVQMFKNILFTRVRIVDN